jgi:hypothetical protein
MWGLLWGVGAGEAESAFSFGFSETAHERHRGQRDQGERQERAGLELHIARVGAAPRGETRHHLEQRRAHVTHATTGREDDGCPRVIEQARSDRRQIGDLAHTEALELGARTDPRAQQDPGRLDGPRGEHDAPRAQHLQRAAPLDLDADGAVALEEHASHMAAREDAQVVAATNVGVEVATGRAHALAVHLVHGVRPHTLRVRGVVVVAGGEPELATGLDEGGLPRAELFRLVATNGDGPVGAVPLVGSRRGRARGA